MDERRRNFRVKNHGDIKAKNGGLPLEVIDISSTGVLVASINMNLFDKGIIELSINNFSMSISYELLRKEGQKTALVFNNESEIDTLLHLLQSLRNQRKRDTIM